MLDSAVVRYGAIIAGTVLWDLGAVLQKNAVSAMPAGPLPVMSLLRSARWMAGLLFTALGWGMFVFGLDRVPVSAARTITGGSYVILALFSTIFLRSPLSVVEWGALAVVTCGIVLLGLQETAGAAAPPPRAMLVLIGVGCVALVSACILAGLLLLGRRQPPSAVHPRFTSVRLFCYAALSGLLGSAGDLLTKVFLSLLGALHDGSLLLPAMCAAGFITFYLAGFYMLSRAYQVGTVVGGVVISDFFARAGAVTLGALALSERIGGAGAAGLERALGFLLVLGGSVLLGRFSGVSRPPGAPAGAREPPATSSP